MRSCRIKPKKERDTNDELSVGFSGCYSCLRSSWLGLAMAGVTAGGDRRIRGISSDAERCGQRARAVLRGSTTTCRPPHERFGRAIPLCGVDPVSGMMARRDLPHRLIQGGVGHRFSSERRLGKFRAEPGRYSGNGAGESSRKAAAPTAESTCPMHPAFWPAFGLSLKLTHAAAAMKQRPPPAASGRVENPTNSEEKRMQTNIAFIVGALALASCDSSQTSRQLPTTEKRPV